jgi:hypothetical protein
MDRSELINDLRDLLIRIEGTINVLHKPDVIRADRKLQGIQDKARHLLWKVVNEKSGSDETLVKQIQSVTKNETDSNKVI